MSRTRPVASETVAQIAARWPPPPGPDPATYGPGETAVEDLRSVLRQLETVLDPAKWPPSTRGIIINVRRQLGYK